MLVGCIRKYKEINSMVVFTGMNKIPEEPWKLAIVTYNNYNFILIHVILKFERKPFYHETEQKNQAKGNIFCSSRHPLISLRIIKDRCTLMFQILELPDPFAVLRLFETYLATMSPLVGGCAIMDANWLIIGTIPILITIAAS